MKNILVTGGLGFIGSHICVELLNLKNLYGQFLYNVFVIDNLENSEIQTYNKIVKIINQENIGFECSKRFHIEIFDLLDINRLAYFFEMNEIDIIIHCAGKKAVNESIKYPLDYYDSNLNMTLNLLKMIEKYKIEQFVFSSSATVYGNSQQNDNSNLIETSHIGENINNPYGKTKYIQEEILKDFYNVNPQLKCYILRYFNPIGCHPSGIIGENPSGIPNNLMPYIIRVAINNNFKGLFKEECYNKLTIFGNDYDTQDGTCIRDFIHVCDLAKGHIDVLKQQYDNNEHNENIYIFNIGTGKGTSVLELLNAFVIYNNIKFNFKFGPKRNGDEKITICNNDKILSLTEWKPKYNLKDIVEHSWKYICINYSE